MVSVWWGGGNKPLGMVPNEACCHNEAESEQARWTTGFGKIQPYSEQEFTLLPTLKTMYHVGRVGTGLDLSHQQSKGHDTLRVSDFFQGK